MCIRDSPKDVLRHGTWDADRAVLLRRLYRGGGDHWADDRKRRSDAVSYTHLLAESGQNPVAHFLAGELLDFFACILQCFHDGDELEHASPLPCFSDLLKEEYLWSEEYDEEEDEMR